MKVIGLMSGTSADGVDAALVDIGGTGHKLIVKLLAFRTFPYPAPFRVRLLEAMARGTVADACHLNVVLGEWFARAALRALKAAKIPPHRVALIGSHGQTLHHLPRPRREPGLGTVRSTLQLGAPAIIAERTGITTVADFRIPPARARWSISGESAISPICRRAEGLARSGLSIRDRGTW